MHLVQERLHRLMVLIEDFGLLIKGTLTVPMLEAQAIVVVECSDSLFPLQGPGSKFFIGNRSLPLVKKRVNPDFAIDLTG